MCCLYFEDGISQGIKQGISQGITQGISQGKEMAQIECAKKLLRIMSADKIAEVLEMPLDIVQGLEGAGVSEGGKRRIIRRTAKIRLPFRESFLLPSART